MKEQCSFCGEVREVIDGQNGYICKDCCELLYSRFDYKTEVSACKDIKPHLLKRELDKYVIGQDKAKKTLCVAVYNHYKRLNKKGNSKVKLDKSNIMIMGPTGSGKTYIMSMLSQILDIPMVTVDATSFTEAGYIGDDVSSILKKLYVAAEYDLSKAEYGIVYVDEIDKIVAKTESFSSRDVNGMGVQQAFLKIMDGGNQTFTLDQLSKQEVTMNTDNILFVFGGAFIGLDDKTSERMGVKKQKQIGFDNIQGDEKELGKITSEDVIKYGFIPEFMGRIPVIVQLSQLTRDELLMILTKPKNAILRQYKELMKADNIKLEFSDEVIEEILNQAETKNLGARGLRSCIEDCMMEVMYELPKYTGIKEFTITKEVMENPELAVKKYAASINQINSASV